MEIKTNIKVGDHVYWVKDTTKSIRIYEATVEEITLCEYQGALYCTLHSPNFKLNPYPVVHYSFVFPSKEQAEEFREVMKAYIADKSTYPMCYGCVGWLTDTIVARIWR